MARRADCFASFEGGTDAQLLADWRWLIGAADFKVIRVTAFGNLFLRDSAGRVCLLDTTWGRIREVALGARWSNATGRDRRLAARTP